MTWMVRIVVAAALVVGMAAVPAGARAQEPRSPQAVCDDALSAVVEPVTREFEQAAEVLAEGVDYWAVLCTDAGPVYVDLLEDEAPLTVNNFVFLAQQGYYNNTMFHRVLPGFMAQGGDPTGTGWGGPGYTFGDETDNALSFDQPGLLAMANAGPGTNGSQFFITFSPTTWLDGRHTIFGRVEQGLPAAELLTPRNPEENPTFEGSALRTIVVVDDPETVMHTPDPVPDVDHIQALLENNLLPQLSEQFVLAEDYSHVYDLEAEAASWADDGGEALTDYLRTYLADNTFQGSAALLFTVDTCQPELPIWGLSLQVYDYGAANQGLAVVSDDARSEQLVASGAYDSYFDVEDLGRVYSQDVPEEDWCGPDGIYYRLESPYGRYALVVDLVVDGTVIGPATQPSAVDYLAFLALDFLGASVSSALDRGDAAVAAE